MPDEESLRGKHLVVRCPERELADYRDVEHTLDVILLRLPKRVEPVECRIRWMKMEGKAYSENDIARLCVMVPAEVFPQAGIDKRAHEALKATVLAEFDKTVSECRRLQN